MLQSSRIPYESVAPLLELAVQVVQHQVAEQRGKRAALRRSLLRRLDQPTIQHARFQEGTDELQHALVAYPFGDPSHQDIVVDSIEEFLQIQIHHDPITVAHVVLRLGYRLVGRPFRPETVAELRKRRVPSRLKHPKNRLLDHPVDHARDAEFSDSASRLGDIDPQYRLRFVGAAKQLGSDFRPMRPKVAWQFLDSHPVDARLTLVRLDLSQCRLQVILLAHLLHQEPRRRQAFVLSFRHGRFRPFARRARGFTLCRLREGQETLDIPLLFAHESRELLTFPFTSLLERGTVRALSPLSEAYYALG